MPPSIPDNSTPATIQSLLRSAEQNLRRYGFADEALRSSEVLLGFVLSKSAADLIRDADQAVPPKLMERFFSLIDERKRAKPIAYLVNQKEFYSMPFYVDDRVLIPRPETELLVDKAIELIRTYGDPSPVVCDVGTGSGAISIAVKKNCPQAKVIGIDISPTAVQVAKTNANRNAVDVIYMCGDLLESIHVPLDMVLANLPYIPSHDIFSLDSGVKDYEPHLALDGGISGLSLIDALLGQAFDRLKSGGYVLLEFGINQDEELKEMVTEKSFEIVCVLNDAAAIPRVLVARKA